MVSGSITRRTNASTPDIARVSAPTWSSLMDMSRASMLFVCLASSTPMPPQKSAGCTDYDLDPQQGTDLSAGLVPGDWLFRIPDCRLLAGASLQCEAAPRCRKSARRTGLGSSEQDGARGRAHAGSHPLSSSQDAG